MNSYKDPLTKEQREDIITNGDTDQKIWLAQHPDLDVYFMDLLAGSGAAKVRTAVLSRTDVPVHILWVNSYDFTSTVRRAVAANPSCPQELLELMSCESSKSVRLTVAHNPSFKGNIRAVLRNNPKSHPYDNGRYANVLFHPDLPVEFMEMAAVGDFSRPSSLINNPTISMRLLRFIALTADREVANYAFHRILDRVDPDR